MRNKKMVDAKYVIFLIETRHDREMRNLASEDNKTLSWELREAVRDYLKRRGKLPRSL